MPRQRRTLSGDRAQSQDTGAPGVRYGEGQDLAAMREAAPIPNARAGGPPAAPSAPLPVEAQRPGPALPPMPKPGLLRAPSTRPGEAVTQGLTRGPGAGPEVLGVNPVESPTGRFLRDLARMTGRSSFAEIARRSGL